MIDFRGKNVLVTGGSRGIGAACVRLFVELGARVGFTWRTGENYARDLEHACNGMARGWRTNVTDDGQVARFVREADEAWDGVDVAIANAGIWKGARIERMTAEEWDET